jgi:hypothetical protein
MKTSITPMLTPQFSVTIKTEEHLNINKPSAVGKETLHKAAITVRLSIISTN